MSVTAAQMIRRQEGDRGTMPVAASTILYEGAMAFVTPAGYADDDTGSGGNKFAGIVHATVDNSSGSAGDLNVELWRDDDVFELTGSGFSQADVGKKAFATDNFTIATSPGASGLYIGIVEEYVSSTVLRVRIDVDERSGLLFSQVAASTAVTNTVTETAFDQAYTIKANTLRPGNVIRIRAQATPSSGNSTNTLTLKLYLGTTVIIATAAFDVTDAGGDVGYFDVDIVIRTIGASGTLVACGVQALGVPGTVTAKPFLKASTAVDTTADLAVAVKATWSVADPGNSARLDILNVQILDR